MNYGLSGPPGGYGTKGRGKGGKPNWGVLPGPLPGPMPAFKPTAGASNEEAMKAFAREGIPAQRLGRDLAAQLSALYESFRTMTADRIREEYGKLNLPKLGANNKEELTKRLKLWSLWNMLPMAELKLECTESSISIDDVEGSPAEQRQLLLEKLLVHKWCLPAFASTGFPVHGIDDEQQVIQVITEMERYETLGLAELQGLYEGMGFPDKKALDKAELLIRLKLLIVWNALPMTELRRECEERTLVDSNDDEEDRDELLQRLYADLCPNLYGIPLDRFPSATASAEVAQQVSVLHRMTLEELRKQARDWNMPVHDSITKQELANRLQHVPLWLGLPLTELEKECAEWGMSLSAMGLPKRGKETESRQQLQDLLFFSLNGVPVHRFTSFEVVAELAGQFQALSQMSLVELKKQFREWNMPVQENLSKDECLNRLQHATLWWELPLSELKKECGEWDIKLSDVHLAGSDDDKRGHLMDHLLYHICWEALEAQGVPVGFLDTLSAALQVQQEWKDIDAAPLAECKRRYDAIGLPSGSMPKWELGDRLKQVSVWLNMSFASLQRECRQNSLNAQGSPDQKERLAERLVECWWGARSSQGPIPNLAGRTASAWPGGARPNANVWGPPGPGFSGRGQPGRPAPPRPEPGQRHPNASAQPPPHEKQAPKPPPKSPSKPGAPPAKVLAHFATLGLSTSAGLDEVKKAYRGLALKHHPDKNLEAPQGAAQEFLKVSSAYTALTDYLKSTAGKGSK
eukprot:gnl/TRDRNA2_/TRDRNA2_156972_c0_seq2.p1 gnl/TRDRNA2_/TRDRNA2_156972_c0~~gnl/TRDRNA2_/TRDRNA2_156972_c0_seq2.p1  ORF type:complete len:747 (+),score=130.69 gnl/TRDRNA2_/TRDRNA2_156972_c0_seq2:83-2323(+)